MQVANEELSTRSVLTGLTKARLVDIGRQSGVATSARQRKGEQIEALMASGHVRFQSLLKVLLRDELKAACRAHGLDDKGRARVTLAERLLEAHGADDSQPPRPHFVPDEAPRYAPQVRDIVRVRHRQYMVEAVVPPPGDGQCTLVEMTCLDDDHQGRPLRVLWELELGACVLHAEGRPLPEVKGIDPPRHFAAFLHALRWNSVTATDATGRRRAHEAQALEPTSRETGQQEDCRRPASAREAGRATLHQELASVPRAPPGAHARSV